MGEKRNFTTADTLMDLVRNLFPENVVQAALEKVQTEIKYPGPTLANSTIQEDDKETWQFAENWLRGANILGLIIASLVRNIRYNFGSGNLNYFFTHLVTSVYFIHSLLNTKEGVYIAERSQRNLTLELSRIQISGTGTFFH